MSSLSGEVSDTANLIALRRVSSGADSSGESGDQPPWRDRLSDAVASNKRYRKRRSVRSFLKAKKCQIVFVAAVIGILLGFVIENRYTHLFKANRGGATNVPVPWTGVRSHGEEYTYRTDWHVWSLPECGWVDDVVPAYMPDRTSKFARILMTHLLFLNDMNAGEVSDWSLTHGSLLGAYRHDGVIPWDYDIDITSTDLNATYWRLRERGAASPKWRDVRGVVLPGFEWKERYDPLGRTEPVPHTHGKFYSGNYTLDTLGMIRVNQLTRLTDDGPVGVCFGNQCDFFGEDPATNGGIQRTVTDYGPVCRCYFNGIPTQCVEDAAGMLESAYGPDFMLPPDKISSYGGHVFDCP